MKTSKFFSTEGKTTAARPASKSCLAAVLVVLVGLSCDLTLCRAQSPDGDVAGATVLTRGPVHEAFAGIVTFNPEPGVVVTKAPPELIEEMPPAERPEGDDVTWIPGYWGWDDERGDFLWVSGTWRDLPPGREWMAGYWGQTSRGYQWTSGYWADASAQETTYLPPPPATVEVGPNIAAPSDDYGWTPGCWVWHQQRYAWTPGYWAQGRADWDWIPAHYVWTPRGYIYVGGYWDYTVERRGVLFAPVYFESSYYSHRGYHYSPSIVISLNVFSDHLFLRPNYHHYYFGDYYAPSYYQSGFYASFSFQSSHHGYDPFYSHQRWEHRRDRDWERRVTVSYEHRRDHEDARPPRTWAAQRNINPATAESRENRVLVAAPIEQVAKRKDSPMRFQPVAKEERQQMTQRGQEVQKSREQRRTLEARADTATTTPGKAIEPAKVKMPRSPIVAKAANQSGRKQAPPEAQRAPQPDLKRQPKSEPADRAPAVERSNPQSQPRGKPESVKPSKPERNEVAPREKQVQPQAPPRAKESEPKAPEQSPPDVRGSEKKAQQDSERRANDAAVKAREDSQRNARGLEKKTQQESEQRARDSAVKARDESQRNANAQQKQAQQDSERRTKAANAKAQEDSQRNAREMEKRSQPAPQPRATAPPAQSPPGSQRSAGGPEKQAPRASEQSAGRRAEPGEKGAGQLMRNDRQQQGKGQAKKSDDSSDAPRR
jgi:hypothetical protein